MSQKLRNLWQLETQVSIFDMFLIDSLILNSLKSQASTVKKLLTLSKLKSQQSWYSKAGVLNLLVLAYPQIKIYLLFVPPNHNLTAKKLLTVSKLKSQQSW